MFGNQPFIPHQNMFQQHAVQGQFAGTNYNLGIGSRPHRFVPMIRNRSSFPPPRMGQFTNITGVCPGTGIPVFPPGTAGTNPTWGTGPQKAGSQGFIAPGYPSQGYNQGYGGQPPVQPAWEKPKKGGIKGFLSNLMTKRKG
ncbi:MAG: hypothetical protein PHZ11_02580 [Desulfitobacteriaceae bacterium]|nr:hypothetical protein [Desulfitobacteriaceae bacterium]MDD4345781.1 hypothetical protein [Desulfitobacteriaceae bacterium]MDD4401480.1 hypothetical protein [Desulfitobacteriaceae bacterium]